MLGYPSFYLTLMAKLFELRKLSQSFYNDYPSDSYPEMEQKLQRPYVVLLVRINELKFAIPLRTNIRHSFCYKFKKSDRETDSTTGIDYSKAVVIKKESYLSENTDINDKEYLELQEKGFFIVKQFKKYVDGYISFKKHGGNEFVARKYVFSTLKYFDDVLLN